MKIVVTLLGKMCVCCIGTASGQILIKTSQTFTGYYTFSIYIFNNFNHEDSQEGKVLMPVLTFVCLKNVVLLHSRIEA
jgi:hypothetical protein